MKVGKLSAEKLQKYVLDTIKFTRGDVLVHAGLGEDCAVLDFGDQVCLISSDPITGAAQDVGLLAVHVACNDIAANGGTPVGVQVVLLAPEQAQAEQIRKVMLDIQKTASLIGVEVLGGHTEITGKVKDFVLAVTAVGRAPKDRYVTSKDARPGDALLFTKGAAIEATVILAQEYSHLLSFPVSEGEINYFKERLSVVPEGIAAARYGVHAMHDITEGGLLGAAWEMCQASKVGAEIWKQAVEIPELTLKISRELGLDPLALLSSGSMLISCPQGPDLAEELAKEGIPAFLIGEIKAEPELVLIDEMGARQTISGPVEDELWKFIAMEAKRGS